MQILRAVLVAVAVAFAGVQQAHAQEPTQQQYEAVMRWASAHQRIIYSAVEPLQQMPVLSEDSRATRLVWVNVSRTWIASYRARLRDVRAEAGRLGPTPQAGAISEPYMRQHAALPDLLSGLEGFLAELERNVEAVERDDPTAATLTAISSVDAQILIMTQFRNFNSLQAETISDGPQRYLLRSFAASYDALIAVLRERRGGYLGQTISPASIAAVRAAAAAMREHSRDGRVAAQQAEGALPATAPPDQSDFLRRLRLAFQSFGRSFDREEEIASHISSIADLMASRSRFPEIEDGLSPHADRVGVLDLERGADIQQRTTLVQTVTPPT